MDIAKYIDHTVLAADARKEKIESLCKEAYQHGFASVCVNSCWVSMAAKLLEGTEVKVCTVVGFPLGAMDSVSKADEARNAVRNGQHRRQAFNLIVPYARGHARRTLSLHSDDAHFGL